MLSAKTGNAPAILNTGNSFELKTIEGSQMSLEGLHGFKNKDAEKVSYRSPEFNFRAQTLMQSTKEAATPLLNLIDSEGWGIPTPTRAVISPRQASMPRLPKNSLSAG